MRKRGERSKVDSFLSKKVSNRLSYTIIAAFAFVLVGVFVLAQTAPNPGHDYTQLNLGPLSVDGTNNRIGIGTTSSPEGRLDVKSSGIDTYQFIIRASDNSRLLSVYETAAGDGIFELKDNVGTTRIWLGASGNSYLNSGNVGIGTTSPASKLHVAGNLEVDGEINSDILRINDDLVQISNPSLQGYIPIKVSGGQVYYAPVYINLASVAPSAPSNLGAIAIGQTISLSWTDNSNNENYFEIQRNGASLTNVSAETTGYDDFDLSPSTTYTYTVRACNNAGCSSWSNSASDTTSSSGSEL